jgi:hypothetical protein
MIMMTEGARSLPHMYITTTLYRIIAAATETYEEM